MEISKDNLRKHISYLASGELKGREFASEEDMLAAQYIQKHFKEYGLVAPKQCADYLQKLPFGGQNVIGVLNGNNPELSTECLVIDAHHDHMGPGFVGASDNAAGVAILLELARLFATSKEKIQRSLLFTCFDGEEQILNIDGKKQLMQGATYYVQNPVFDLKNIAAMLTLDTLGRNALSNNLMFILGTERSVFLQSIIDDCPTNLRKIIFSINMLTGIKGNYLPFVDKKIPSLFITNGIHQDYHGKGDSPEKLSDELLFNDTAFLIELISRIDNSENKPDFCRNPICPQGEAEDILHLLTLLKEAVSKNSPERADKFDYIISKLAGKASQKDMKQAVQIVLGFSTPNFAKLYLLLNDAQNAEKKKDYKNSLTHYNRILELYNEYRIPYIWLQDINDKVQNLQERI
ncbi:MAG: M28 family metallopeptidase [Nitrososphaerales archaeon]